MMLVKISLYNLISLWLRLHLMTASRMAFLMAYFSDLSISSFFADQCSFMWFFNCTSAACLTYTCSPASSTISIRLIE